MELQLCHDDKQFSLHYRRLVHRFCRNVRSRRFAGTFDAMCIAFGAAIGVVMTEVSRAYSLAIPVALLAIVLLLCDQGLTISGRRARGT